MSGKSEEIVELLSPTVQALGMELLGIEYAASGSSALRFGNMAANARSLPSLTCGAAVPGVANAMCTRPPSRSTMSGPSPL